MLGSHEEATVETPRAHFRAALLLASASIGGLGCAGPAVAAPAEIPTQPDIAPIPKASIDKPGSLIVTGSNLPQAGGIGLAPLIVIDRHEFKLAGTANAETLLNDLPQLIPGLTAFNNNGGDGSVKLDLRGFGNTHTLVLVNGRRWIPDGTGELIDINSIPVSLIDSVEIATGGGSVAYGSGAVAGTVNFKLRGIDGPISGVTSAFNEKGDGARADAYVGYGAGFASGRGHVSIFGDYLRRRPISASQRSFSHFSLTDDLANDRLIPTGSSAVPGGYFESFTDEFFGLGTNYGLIATFPTAGGVSRPFDFGSPANPLGDFFNFEPDNYLMIPEERWFTQGRVDYEFSPSARVYGELTYVNNKTSQRLAPTPVFTEVLVDTNAVAPYLSPSDLAQLQFISAFEEFFFGGPPGFVDLGIRYRTVQLGPRGFHQDRNAWHGLAGITGDLGSFTYDISYSYARTRTTSRATGDVNQPEFDALVSDGTCNVFGPNLLSDACISAISLSLLDHERIRQQDAIATLSGPVATLPWASDPAKFIIGAEWRSMHGSFSPDPNRAISASGNALAGVSGSYNSKEVFGELGVPLVQRGALHIAELDGGFRYSHYSLANIHNAWSWYAGAKVAPVRDVTFRGNYQRSISAPRMSDLFSGSFTTFPLVFDPCSIFADDFSDAVRQSCIAAGVPPANVFNIDYFPFIPTTIGGNRRLRAEKGDSWTVGIVLKPRVLPGLTASFDYYNLRLKNLISSMSGQGLADMCHLIVQDASSQFCQRIARDPTTGEIVAIDGSELNFGARKNNGIDAVIDYVVPLRASLLGAGHSSLAWHLAGTWLDRSSFRVADAGGPIVIKCAGRFGLNCGPPQPRWTWQSRLSWVDGLLTTSVRWRHTGAVRDDEPQRDFVVERIHAYDLIDLAFEVDVNKQFSMELGANNLFDKHPPILGANADFSGGNTYPAVYDILGRDFFVSADIRF